MPTWNPTFHIEPAVEIDHGRTSGFYEFVGPGIIVAWARVRTRNQPRLEAAGGHHVKIDLPLPSINLAPPHDLGWPATIGWIEGFPADAGEGIIGWVGSHGDRFMNLSKLTGDAVPGQRWRIQGTRLGVDFSVVYVVAPPPVE